MRVRKLGKRLLQYFLATLLPFILGILFGIILFYYNFLYLVPVSEASTHYPNIAGLEKLAGTETQQKRLLAIISKLYLECRKDNEIMSEYIFNFQTEGVSK